MCVCVSGFERLFWLIGDKSTTGTANNTPGMRCSLVAARDWMPSVRIFSSSQQVHCPELYFARYDPVRSWLHCHQTPTSCSSHDLKRTSNSADDLPHCLYARVRRLRRVSDPGVWHARSLSTQKDFTLPQNSFAELIPAKKNCSCMTK